MPECTHCWHGLTSDQAVCCHCAVKRSPQHPAVMTADFSLAWHGFPPHEQRFLARELYCFGFRDDGADPPDARKSLLRAIARNARTN